MRIKIKVERINNSIFLENLLTIWNIVRISSSIESLSRCPQVESPKSLNPIISWTSNFNNFSEVNQQDLSTCLTFFFLKSSKTMLKSNLRESSKPQIFNVFEYTRKMKKTFNNFKFYIKLLLVFNHFSRFSRL
jgi:hypothetical protein